MFDDWLCLETFSAVNGTFQTANDVSTGMIVLQDQAHFACNPIRAVKFDAGI